MKQVFQNFHIRYEIKSICSTTKMSEQRKYFLFYKTYKLKGVGVIIVHLPSETQDQFFKHTQIMQDPNSEKYLDIHAVQLYLKISVHNRGTKKGKCLTQQNLSTQNQKVTVKATNLTLLPVHSPWQHSFKLAAKTLAWEVVYPGCQATPTPEGFFRVIRKVHGVFGRGTRIWVP